MKNRTNYPVTYYFDLNRMATNGSAHAFSVTHLSEQQAYETETRKRPPKLFAGRELVQFGDTYSSSFFHFAKKDSCQVMQKYMHAE